MTNDIALLKGVRDALRADTRIGFDERPIALTLSNGNLVMEGEVADVSAKRRALRRAAEVSGPVSSTDCMSDPRCAWKTARSATLSAMR